MAKFKSGRITCQRASVIALVLTFLLPVIFPSADYALASTDTARWSRVPIPAEGSAGNWQLASGSNVRHLTMAADGSLYAYGEGLTYTLYKSTDGGYRWSNIGNVQDSIVAIATSPVDAGTVYYATSSCVYRSTNGGNTFTALPPNPGGAGNNTIEITSLAVAFAEESIIVVGTRDTSDSQFGGIYTLNDSPYISSWVDTGLTGYDVYAVAFSPNYPVDRQLAAVVTDETDTLITYQVGSSGWGATTGTARLNRDNAATPAPVAVADSAAIAFPANYNASGAQGTQMHYVAIDTGSGNGDVYRINCVTGPAASVATDLNIGYADGQSNTDVTGLAVTGDSTHATILAGAASSALTYFSADGGMTWMRSRREPTGGSQTFVLLAPDFASGGTAYAGTSGSDSAFSISHDKANTWHQIGLIDTAISTIVDLSPSPALNQETMLFMLTFGSSNHSLWRSLDGGTTWARILSGSPATVDSLALVALSPEYGTGSQVVYLAGSSNGITTVWKSPDNGETFTGRFALDPATGNPITIDTWAIANDTTLFLGSFDGSNGRVYRTCNSGTSYSTGAWAGNQSLHSIALSPDYQQDKTLLVGNTNGGIYYSTDDGISFQPLPADAATPPLTGLVTVAFDPNFTGKQTVYAASSTADYGLYRFVIGSSTDWENIDGTLPDGSMLSQIRVSSTGTFYASNTRADGGMERCFDPTFPLSPTFETVTRGLSDGATLSGLWQQDNRLWSIDTANVKLMTFTDSLDTPVLLSSPAGQASGIGVLTNHAIQNVSLEWKPLRGATSYQWQLDYDTDFSAVPGGFEGTTRASSVHLPALEPATTYYWRVRTSAPVSSPWSARWSFTTGLDSQVVPLKPESPEAGAENAPVRPIFQWAAVTGADAYELMVARDADFTSPSITKLAPYALSTTAWQCDVTLDYETTYYWKIRAISATTHGDWSSVAAFTTESAPSLPAPEAPSPSPAPSVTRIVPIPAPGVPTKLTPPAPIPPPPQVTAPPQVPVIPTWTVYVIGALLLTIILTLAIMLILVLTLRRL